MGARFFLGFAAECERLWSSTYRKVMTPLILETILFLMVNLQYWGSLYVSRSMAAACSERVAQLMTDEDVQDELLEPEDETV